MDFALGDSESADDIEDSSAEAALDPQIRGVVTQRSLAQQELPPANFVLADPQTRLPVMRLQIRLHGGDRIRVVLWGLWCDRLSEIVRSGDDLCITGGCVTVDETQVPGERTHVTLPPAGASPKASVVVENGSRRVEVTISSCIVKPKPSAGNASHHVPLQMRTTVAQSNGDGNGAAGNVSVRPTKRAKASRGYEYTTICQLPMRTGEGGNPKEVRNAAWPCFEPPCHCALSLM